MNTKMILLNGRPDDLSHRQDKEIRVYDFLDQLNITYQRIDHEPAMTMDDCAEIDLLLNATICKNLFLCNAQKTKFYLLMIRNDKKFKTKEISKQINSARLSFANETYMEEFLDITPGSVSVMGLMNDHQHQVRLLVDEDVINGEYLGCHPCINTSSLRLKTKDVFDIFVKATGHDITTVHLDGE